MVNILLKLEDSVCRSILIKIKECFIFELYFDISHRMCIFRHELEGEGGVELLHLV